MATSIETLAYLEWDARQRNTHLTWDERFGLYRMILAARPDLRGLIHDFSNADLVEEAQNLGITWATQEFALAA